MLTAGGVLLFLGLFATLFAMAWGYASAKETAEQEEFESRGRKATGVVTRRWKEDAGVRRGSPLMLDVRFFDGEMNVVGTAVVNNPPVWEMYDAPQRVPIRFVPGKPQWLRVEGDSVAPVDWTAAIAAGVLAALLLTAGAFTLWLGWRARARHAAAPARF
jgi:hypothetical protein